MLRKNLPLALLFITSLGAHGRIGEKATHLSGDYGSPAPGMEQSETRQTFVWDTTSSGGRAISYVVKVDIENGVSVKETFEVWMGKGQLSEANVFMILRGNEFGKWVSVKNSINLSAWKSESGALTATLENLPNGTKKLTVAKAEPAPVGSVPKSR